MKMKKLYVMLFVLIVIAGCKKETLIKEEALKKEQESTKEFVQLGGITLLKENGRYIMGGDIILSNAQVEYLKNLKPNKPGTKGTKSTFLTDFGMRWPNGIVYYSIRADVYNQQIIQDAIAHYHANTPIRFVRDSTQTNYVQFVPTTNAWAYSKYGMVGGKQEIELPAASGTATVIHEIGHAIGLMHEMSRADRDAYVDIYPANMQPNTLSNFQKYTDLGIAGGELGSYDFDSVMGYESPFLGINSSYTSTTKNGGYIFYNYVLSAGDIDAINYLYDYSNYKKIYVKYGVINVVDNSSSSWSQDDLLRDSDVNVEFFEDAACTIPYTLVKPLNMKTIYTTGYANGPGALMYKLVPSGVQSYIIGQRHEEVTWIWGVVTNDNSSNITPIANHGYIAVGF